MSQNWNPAVPQLLAEHVRPEAVARAFGRPEPRIDPETGTALTLHELRARRRLRLAVAAVYELLVEQETQYDVEPPPEHLKTQRVRTPQEIARRDGRRGTATCLDLAVSFSAAAMNAGLWPLIVALDDHALALVSLVDTSTDAGQVIPAHGAVLDDRTCPALGGSQAAVAELVTSEVVLALELTVATVSADPERRATGNSLGQLPFEAAASVGAKEIANAVSNFRFVLDPVIAHRELNIAPLAAQPATVVRVVSPRLSPEPGPVSPARRRMEDHAPERRIVLAGPGGMGKSTAASAFAHLRWESGRCDVAWWIDASTEESLIRDLGALAERVQGQDAPDESRAKAEAAQRILNSSDSRAIVVYDNAACLETLERWLPGIGVEAVITTRNTGWRGSDLFGAVLDVEAWSEATARDYLAPHLPDDERDRDALEQILRRMSGLPLALRGIRKQKEKAGRRWRDVLTSLNESGEIAEMNELRSVFETSLRDAETEAEDAGDLLSVLAFLAPQDLPLDRITARLSHSTGIETRRWERARWALIDNALLQPIPTEGGDADDGSAAIHALNAEFARDRQPEALFRAGVLLAVVADTKKENHRPDSRFILAWHPHVIALVQHLEQLPSGLVDEQFLVLVLQAALTLAEMEEAAGEHLLRHGTLGAAMRLTQAHPSMRSIEPSAFINTVVQHALSSLLQGEVDEATAHLRALLAPIDEADLFDALFAPLVRAVLILVQALTEDPRSVLAETSELLGLIDALGQELDGVEDLLAPARNLLLGEVYPLLYNLTGEASRTLEILSEHPDIDDVADDEVEELFFVRLAEAYLELGDHAECLRITQGFEAALNRLGEPATNLALLEMRGLLGASLAQVGRSREAIEVLEMNLHHFAEHSMARGIDFAEQTGFLGAARLSAGHAERAVTTLNEAIDLFEEMVVADHPNLLRVRRARASALLAAGRPDDAVAEMERVVHAYEAQWGSHHPTVADMRSVLTDMLTEAIRLSDDLPPSASAD